MPADTPQPTSALRARPRFGAAGRVRKLRKRVWTVGRLIVLVGALAATFAVFFLASLRVASHVREVEVPDVRGKAVAEATAILADAGLSVRLEPARPDPKVPADHVASQEPEPGATTRRQVAVRIRVSEGVRAPTVPAVVGQAERAADLTLTQAGIAVTTRAEIRESGVELGGRIVAQEPAADSRSTQLALLVGRREESAATFVMPDLIGTLASRSSSALRALGFRVTVTAEVPFPGQPPGIVIRQSPQAGYQVTVDQGISVEVSK